MSARPHARAVRAAPAARSSARREYGAYVVLSVADPDGPAPDPGQFAMLAAAERWGGGADERPFLPRAFSVARRHADGTLDFLLEDVGPGTERLAELRRGRRALAARPARPRLRPAARGPPAGPRRRRRRDRAAGDLAGRARRAGARRCSASATPRTPRARRCCAARAWRPTTARRPPRARHRAARGRARPRRPGRGLRLRPAADARGGARAVRRARRAGAARARVRAWPAASAPASAASSRPATATSGCASTGRCSTPPRWSSSRDQLLRHRAGAPDRQRLGHVRRDRRPAGVRRRAARATSRSPPSSPRRSRSRRARATRRRGCGSWAPG